MPAFRERVGVQGWDDALAMIQTDQFWREACHRQTSQAQQATMPSHPKARMAWAMRMSCFVEEQVGAVEQGDPTLLGHEGGQEEHAESDGSGHQPSGSHRAPGLIQCFSKCLRQRDHEWAWCLATIQSTT
jgi:hypothetical protein